MPTQRYYVGLREGERTLFRADFVPTETTHGNQYAAVIGPFRTKRGAEFMRVHGTGNPHCRCVNDAEKIAAGLKYDVAIRAWVR